MKERKKTKKGRGETEANKERKRLKQTKKGRD